jgi:amidase/aspartyl-tRNA(Asn)/glutamyl-tRNA(Gln) amidotransferase subunit A
MARQIATGPAATTGTISRHIEEQFARMAANAEDAALAVLRRRDEQALAEARAWDALAETTAARPALSGISLAVKACFDVAGWPTDAASKVLHDAAPATVDAPLVAMPRRQGAIVTGHTNMTEFAYGALGLNPHFGTPRSPLDPQRERIAGGSTAGGAAAVALGFADFALGTDTSGSVRIPAAFCGVAAFKPSRGRYPDEGMLFLSPSFDVPGFIARDIATCALADQAVAGEAKAKAMPPASLHGRRFLVPPRFALEAADATVTALFREALKALRDAGAEIVERDWPELATYGPIAVEGGILAAEAFEWHQPYLETRADAYDRRVGPRIALGEGVKAAAYVRAKQRLSKLAAKFHRDLDGFDALLTPTVATIPPRLADLEADDAYYAANREAFRLTEVANRIDAPSVSLPIDPQSPVGLSLTGFNGRDRALLGLSAAVEAALRAYHH